MACPVGRDTARDPECRHYRPLDRSPPYSLPESVKPPLEPVQETPGPDKLPGPDPQTGEDKRSGEQRGEHPERCSCENDKQSCAKHRSTEAVVRRPVVAERLAPGAAIGQAVGLVLRLPC